MRLQVDDALIVVDVQRDFLPGGSLPVPDGDAVVTPINLLLRRFEKEDLPIFATRDWHPQDHCSFVDRGGSWPPHCVQDSTGSEFAPTLRLPNDATIVSKGTHPVADAYSGFDGTDLELRLKEAGVRRVIVGGLATDYCVLATVRDAVAAGFDVVVVDDAIRAVNVEARDGDTALKAMRDLGVSTANSAELVG